MDRPDIEGLEAQIARQACSGEGANAYLIQALSDLLAWARDREASVVMLEANCERLEAELEQIPRRHAEQLARRPSPREGLRAIIESVPGAQVLSIDENRTSEPITPHSLRVTVDGGDDQQLLDAIANYVPLGVAVDIRRPKP